MQQIYPAAEFLLVDDDPSVSEFLATYLSERGHPSNATVEGEKALKWLSQNRCEVVVVDLNLPNANGISLIASLRAIDARLPIVVFTERGCDEAQVRAAMRAGARDRKSTRLNSNHVAISYAVFCLKKKKNNASLRTYGDPS